MAYFALGVPEGRGRQVDVDGGVLAHQLFQRIEGVEAARPEILIVPRILADGDGEPQTIELDDLLPARGQKVALFVEYVVEGQQALVLFEQDLASVEEDGGVDGRLAGIGRRGQRDACDHSGGQLLRGCGKFVDGSAAAREKTWFFEEVGGGIAADGQLGKNHKAGALTGGAPGNSDDFFKIAGEIPDRGVDLGQRDIHISSLMQGNEKAAR